MVRFLDCFLGELPVMCQLLSMNCNVPTDIVFSFEGFHRRGGLTDEHKDGFGIAFFEEQGGVRLFLDDKPSAHSPIAKLIREYPIKSENVIAHIRKATQGSIHLANTHPFVRELWGEYWVFAHNGDLKNYAFSGGNHYQSVGQTDSEQAFCFLLEHLKNRFEQNPGRDVIFFEINQLAQNIRAFGTFNFILSNGQWMIAHCSTLLHYIIRRAPFGQARLIDNDISIDFAQETTINDRVAVIATTPLTLNEEWTQIPSGTALLFQDGEIVTTAV